MILLYSEEITPRIKYISRLLFSQILQTEISFTTDSASFRDSQLPKINYSFEKFDDEIYIQPHRLMHDNTLEIPTIEAVWYENEKYFFESSDDSVLPFDPLAASFFLVTRFEEYGSKTVDNYNRYKAENSILAKYGLLKKPVINIWANLLANKIAEKYNGLHFAKQSFNFISTIDIDNAWAYKYKGFFRTSGALLKSVIKGNFTEFKSRIKVLTNNEPDPYDSYKYLTQEFKGNEDKVLFFFLLGDYGHFDKNVSYKNKHLIELIQNTKKRYDIGIHPSFASSKNEGAEKVKTEKERLEKICGGEITKSRQHFLRLKFPNTYLQLIDAGIAEDYSMGYASQPGFRAGICTPYYFYDLKNEVETNLLIVPFQVMDGTFLNYLKLSPEEAIQQIEKIMIEVKKVGGTFVSIWHNETVTDTGLWKNYRQVFEKINRLGFKWANEE